MTATLVTWDAALPLALSLVDTFDAGVAGADALPEVFACIAGPTSGCLPDNGVVLSPHPDPVVLNVLPYIRQML